MKIEFGGRTTAVTSDAAGIIDARLPLDSPLEPGTARALVHLTGRKEVPANVRTCPTSRGCS